MTSTPAVGSSKKRIFGSCDNAFAIMRSDEGIVAQIHSSATQWRHKFNLEITLQQGSIIMQGILSGSKSYGEEELIIIRHNPDSRDTSLDEKIETFKNDLSWDKEINYFFHARKKPRRAFSLHHAAHAAHIHSWRHSTWHTASSSTFIRSISNHSFCSDHQASNRACSL
mgnify:CR=1 FL=1